MAATPLSSSSSRPQRTPSLRWVLLMGLMLLALIAPACPAEQQQQQPRRKLQATTAPTPATPAPSPSPAPTMGPTPAPTNGTAAPTVAPTVAPTPTPAPTHAPTASPMPPAGDGSEPHGLTGGQKFGVFLSVMIIGAALFYIYRFYRRNYWGNQSGAAGTGAGQRSSSGGRRQANVRTAGGRGGQPLLQEEDWL